MRLWLLLTLIVLQTTAAAAAAPAPGTVAPPSAPVEAVSHISLITLLGNPERYDGELVSVTGFLNLEFEGDALYVSKADYAAMISKNAVWIDGPKFEEMAARDRLDNRYVTVIGRFDADQRGHLDSFAASIETVSVIQIHPTRREIVLISRPDFYTLKLPAPVDIPWPLILIGLWLWTAALAVLRGRQSGSGQAWIGRATLALAIALSIFAIVRIQGSTIATWALMRGWIGRDLYMDLSVLELILSLIGVVALWVFYGRRRWAMVLAVCGVLLVVPTAIEAVRFNGWAPVSETSPWFRDGEWTRTRPGPSYADRIEFSDQ